MPLPIFCERYSISPIDHERLSKLEVEIGDAAALESLEREDWVAVGFTKLAWGRFLEKHRQFLRDAKDGKV